MRTTRLEMRLTPHDLEVLDRRRGSQTRSDWLRRRIHEDTHTHTPGDLIASKDLGDQVHTVHKCQHCPKLIDTYQEKP